MGIFTCCPACGSDYCTGCDCVEEKYRKRELELEGHLTKAIEERDALQRRLNNLAAPPRPRRRG